MGFKKLINTFIEDIIDMPPYERWRVLLQIVHIVITLGVPFVAVALNIYFTRG